jgi:DHA2 family lincomycin resistance protein-like MFS transporter
MMSMFGVFILLPIYLLSVLGQTTLTTGLLLLPGGLIMGLCAPFVGRLFDRYGPARLVIPGAILFSGVMWSLTFISTTTPVWVVLAIHIVLSIGLALMFTPLFTVSLGSLPPKLYSHGSAIIGTTQQVAGAAGTTLYVAIMTWRAGILTQGEADAATAAVGGMQSAFFVGALISLAAVAASLYVRRPPNQPEGQPMGGH